MQWIRIDNRLIHGQIIETWLPFTDARVLIVANDELAADTLRQEIMSLAVPEDIKLVFIAVDSIGSYIDRLTMRNDAVNYLVLFANCQDARYAYEKGFTYPNLNIGNLHYGAGKKQLCSHVAVGKEDEDCLQFLEEKGVEFDFRCVPNDTAQVRPYR